MSSPVMYSFFPCPHFAGANRHNNSLDTNKTTTTTTTTTTGSVAARTIDSRRVESLTSRLVENLRSSIADLVAEVVADAGNHDVADAGNHDVADAGAPTVDAGSTAEAESLLAAKVDAEEATNRADALEVTLKEIKWCHKQVRECRCRSPNTPLRCRPGWRVRDAGVRCFR